MSRRMKKALAKKMEELEVTKKARLQIERYKRQYKIMEGSRLAYNEELSVQLEKLKGQLEQLEVDKNNLEAEGIFLASASIKLRKVKLQDRIDSLLKQKVFLEEEVKEARSNLLHISSQIMSIEAVLDHERLRRIDRQAKLQALQNRESKISYFESQLSMETVELNKLITKNRLTREEMESLLRERARFKEQLDKLLARLSGGRLLLHDLMEQGTSAFEHREEAQNKVQLLRRKMVVLKEKHGQAMRDLERELEDNIRSAAFLTTKGQERGGKAVRVEEEESRRLVVQEEVHRLEQIYNRISVYFQGIPDTAAMADQFLIQEDENFAIFNYVNEVNCEVESLQTAAEEIRRNLLKEEKKKEEELKQQKPEIVVLLARLDEKKRLVERLVKEREEIVQERNTIIKTCQEMYNQIMADSSPFEVLLDKHHDAISAEYCLKLLEKRLRVALKALGRDVPSEPHFSIKAKKVTLPKRVHS